jgi:hypothetical protein
MTRRRDFIRNSIVGSGLAVAGMGFKLKSFDSVLTSNPIEAGQSQKDWHRDPEWRKIKYGEWGGPGVSAGPGPMDTVLVKDYAPRSSVVTKETFIAKAKFPVIDCHIHVVAETADEVAEWVNTMDEVGIEKSIILTESTGAAFNRHVELFLKKYPERFCFIVDWTQPKSTNLIILTGLLKNW